MTNATADLSARFKSCGWSWINAEQATLERKEN